MPVNRTEWIRRAALRVLGRNQGISAWDALVMAAAVAERARGEPLEPEAAVDLAFLGAEAGDLNGGQREYKAPRADSPGLSRTAEP
jgi:hypothetical protein